MVSWGGPGRVVCGKLLIFPWRIKVGFVDVYSPEALAGFEIKAKRAKKTT